MNKRLIEMCAKQICNGNVTFDSVNNDYKEAVLNMLKEYVENGKIDVDTYEKMTGISYNMGDE